MGDEDLALRAESHHPLGERNSGPQTWLRWRAPVWVRLIVVVVAADGVVAGARWTAETYRETAAYRQAADCRAEAGSCVGLEEATVIDKAKAEGCTGSGSNRDCTSRYRLRTDAGRRIEWLDVSSETYDAAFRGSRAELQTWQDAVVGITVRGHTQTFPPPSENAMWSGTAAVWLLLGLALRAGLSGFPGSLVQPASVGRAFLTLPLVFLVDNALFGAGVGKWLIAAALAVGVVGGTVGAQRHERSKQRRQASATAAE